MAGTFRGEADFDALVRPLVEEGRLTAGEAERVRRLAAENGDSPWNLLLRLGLVAEKDLADALAKGLGLSPVEEEEIPEVPLLQQEVSPRFLHDARILPLRMDQGRLHLAMADPTDRFTIEAMEALAGCPLVPRVATPSLIENALNRLYDGPEEGGREEASPGEPGENRQDAETLRDLASEAPVVRLVNQLIQQAVEIRASDIHLEPFEEGLRVRYRVDGVLVRADTLPATSTAAVVSRIKLMARLDIAERRLPQDGRFSQRSQGRKLDFRVSTVPTLHGESVVLRLLDQGDIRFDFESLGFGREALQRLEGILRSSHGIVLVTGPTGSGKSTTLYTALNRLNTEERKIITVEDPVEYRLDGINQIQVKPRIGLTFANALRSIVRQDPDIIMVGEMRDTETARIAVQSALTGHLVLSTLHTNDAAGGITRLLDMGVEPYLITATVNGILAQRLVRRLCPHCAGPAGPPPGLAETLEAELPPGESLRFRRPVGCDACRGIGYRGRLALAEILVMDETLHRLVMAGADTEEIRAAAVAAGMTTLREDGLAKVAAGLTTLEEVARVTEA